MSKGFDWLNGMVYGVRNVVDESDELTTADTIRFTGDGVTATYDSGNKRINVEIPGLAGSISWSTVTGLAASATAPFVVGGSQYIGVTHVRTGATPATSKGQIRATDGVILAAKIDGTDETVLQTSGSTVQVGDNFGPIRERPADASNWYVEDGTGVRLLASSTAVGVNRRLYLYGGSATTATAKGHVGLDSTGRLTVYADGEEKTCLVTGDAGGGAPSRIVALDAHDIIEWKLDEAVAPWANTGNGGALNLEAVGAKAQIIHGGSIHGDRCVQCDYNSDSYFRSPPTAVGESEAGTVHGWVRLADSTGAGRTIVSKDASGFGASPFSIVIGTDTAYAAGISVDVAGTRTGYDDSNSVEGWIPRQHWTHLAVTWAGGVVRVFINGRQLTKTGTHGAHTWAGGRWCIGYGNAYAANGDYSSWRVCDVARSAAYIDEVYKRSVGLYP